MEIAKYLIFDFVGVVADTNYVKMIWDMSMAEKFSALRVLLLLKKNPEVKDTFTAYQKGKISRQTLREKVAEHCPKAAYMVDGLLDRIPKYTKVNRNVLEYISALREHGIKTFIISNAIPETKEIIFNEQQPLTSFFDGIVLSNDVGLKKPSREIFEYTCKKYDIDPLYTLFVDDSAKNLRAAEQLGISPVQCKSTEETCDFLDEMLMIIKTFADTKTNDGVTK